MCRVLQGLSASGELTGANVLVLEHAPSDRRGRAVAIVNVAGNAGAFTAAAVGFVLARVLQPEQLAAWGWRVAFVVAALIGLVGIYLRTRVMESPAFVALGDAPKHDRAPLVRALRTAKRRLLVVTVWIAAASLGGFMLVGFLPSYLIRVGRLSPADAFAANGLSVIVLALWAPRSPRCPPSCSSCGRARSQAPWSGRVCWRSSWARAGCSARC
jgi:MHS family proline/betaine transporter-like MFS transporter